MVGGAPAAGPAGGGAASLGLPRAGGSADASRRLPLSPSPGFLSGCLRAAVVNPPAPSYYFLSMASKQLTLCGFVHCLPPPSPPFAHLSSPAPLHLRTQQVVTFLAVKKNTKVILIFVKAPSPLQAAFAKQD